MNPNRTKVDFYTKHPQRIHQSLGGIGFINHCFFQGLTEIRECIISTYLFTAISVLRDFDFPFTVFTSTGIRTRIYLYDCLSPAF